MNNIDITLDMVKAIEFVGTHLNKDLSVYISIDLDSIDINYINSPSALGFSLKNIYVIVKYVKDNYNIVGFNLVELDRLVGGQGGSLSDVSELLFHISEEGRGCGFESRLPLNTDLSNPSPPFPLPFAIPIPTSMHILNDIFTPEYEQKR